MFAVAFESCLYLTGSQSGSVWLASVRGVLRVLYAGRIRRTLLVREAGRYSWWLWKLSEVTRHASLGTCYSVSSKEKSKSNKCKTNWQYRPSTRPPSRAGRLAGIGTRSRERLRQVSGATSRRFREHRREPAEPTQKQVLVDGVVRCGCS